MPSVRLGYQERTITRPMDDIPSGIRELNQISRVEGILQIETRKKISSPLALILGVRVECSFRGRVWDREPWCRLIASEFGTSPSDVNYQINWRETYWSEGRSQNLRASVEKADSTGLYQVKLEFL